MSKAAYGLTTEDIESKPSRRSAIAATLGLAAAATVPTADAATPTVEGPNLFDWEAFDLNLHMDAIRRDLKPESWAAQGEATAAHLNCKTREQLTAFAARLDDDGGTVIVEALTQAAENLRTRLALVCCALARLEVAAEPLK